MLLLPKFLRYNTMIVTVRGYTGTVLAHRLGKLTTNFVLILIVQEATARRAMHEKQHQYDDYDNSNTPAAKILHTLCSFVFLAAPPVWDPGGIGVAFRGCIRGIPPPPSHPGSSSSRTKSTRYSRYARNGEYTTNTSDPPKSLVLPCTESYRCCTAIFLLCWPVASRVSRSAVPKERAESGFRGGLHVQLYTPIRKGTYRVSYSSTTYRRSDATRT